MSLKKQYPPVQKTYEKFTTVEELLNKVSKEGYSEKEIEETFSYIKQLISKTKYTEATQLLLVCASTKSKFGQLMLARELFKGVLLQKNIPEAFELMKALATDDYPEALCDLGQFYENAIGTTENKIKAEKLYKEATKAGIKRAKKHHARLKKQNKAFF
jgi:TPR repeat protein